MHSASLINGHGDADLGWEPREGLETKRGFEYHLALCQINISWQVGNALFGSHPDKRYYCFRLRSTVRPRPILALHL
jgi:hypothetical protein